MDTTGINSPDAASVIWSTRRGAAQTYFVIDIVVNLLSIALVLAALTMGDEGEDGLWEKPAWAKGGVKLRSTGKADVMKTSGNLAAPITFTPFKNEDHSNKVANPEKLRPSEVGQAVKSGENLAAPITFTPFKNEDHSNLVANPDILKSTEVGAAAKEGYDLAAPITFTPYKNEDHSNKVANAEILRKTDVGEAVKQGQNLAMPITNIREEIRKVKK